MAWVAPSIRDHGAGTVKVNIIGASAKFRQTADE
jgi:hypothetical protein